MASPEKRFQLNSEQECLPNRISELPESLLMQILSLLPMKYAVRTGILSKRWQRLWTHVDCLDFDCGNLDDDQERRNDLEKFVSFVDNSLMQCTCPKFKKFSFRMDNANDTEELLEKWLRYVFSKKVGFLKIEFLDYVHPAPGWFLHNSELLHLELGGWVFHLHRVRSLNWTALRSLSLKSFFVHDDDDEEEVMGALFSGCPSLEILVLSGYNGINFRTCVAPNVRKLKLVDFEPYGEGMDVVLEINAPSIRELEVTGEFTGAMIQLIDVSSLVSAKLTFQHCIRGTLEGNVDDVRLDAACKLLESVNHVKELVLGPHFTQVLSVLALKEFPSPMFKCCHLALESHVLEIELAGIARLLQTSTNLETFSLINMTGSPVCLLPLYIDELRQNEEKVLSPPIGSFLRLKNVNFSHCRNLCFKEQYRRAYLNRFYELELAQYICDNAPVLEKVIISKPTSNCQKCLLKCAARHQSLLLSTLFDICVGRKQGSKWECRGEESQYSAHFSCF